MHSLPSTIPAPLLPEVDPFPASPCVSSYVAVPSHEQVLAYLEAKLCEAPGVVELCGTGGVGKSLLMRVLAQRLRERFQAVHVPIPTLTAAELGTWVARSAAPARALDPRVWWRRRRRVALPQLLLVEDAQRLSPDARDWFDRFCADHGARAVLAFTEELRARPAEARRTFVEPLGLGEVGEYVARHLQRCGAGPDIRRLFEGQAAQTLALASRGIPRAIHRIADERLLALAALSRIPPGVRPKAPPRGSARPGAGETRRRARGDLMAGVSAALFLGSLMLSVPSPLTDGPPRPAPALDTAPPAMTLPAWRTAAEPNASPSVAHAFDRALR